MTGAKFTFLNDKNGALWKVWKIKRKKNQITPFSSCLLSATFMHCLESGFDCIAAVQNLFPQRKRLCMTRPSHCGNWWCRDLFLPLSPHSLVTPPLLGFSYCLPGRTHIDDGWQFCITSHDSPSNCSPRELTYSLVR